MIIEKEKFEALISGDYILTMYDRKIPGRIYVVTEKGNPKSKVKVRCSGWFSSRTGWEATSTFVLEKTK